MTESDITVLDMASGAEVRTISRDIGGATKHMQGIVPYRAGIMNSLLLFAQEIGSGSIGDTITLKNNYTAKPSDDVATSSSQYRVLTRRPVPSDSVGVTGYFSKTTQSTADNTLVIPGIRFFLDETFLEDLIIKGSVKIRATVGLVTNNASGTAHLQQVIFNLLHLTGNDTYTTLASKTINTGLSNSTTTEIIKSVFAIIPVENMVIEKNKDLVLEIKTTGKITNASYIATHKLYFEAGTSRTYIEIPTEEA